MNIFENLLLIIGGERDIAPTTCRNNTITGTGQKNRENKIPRKFRYSIENLKEKYPELFLSGGESKLSLQDMLSLCLRDRRRRLFSLYYRTTFNVLFIYCIMTNFNISILKNSTNLNFTC